MIITKEQILLYKIKLLVMIVMDPSIIVGFWLNCFFEVFIFLCLLTQCFLFSWNLTTEESFWRKQAFAIGTSLISFKSRDRRKNYEKVSKFQMS